MQWWPLRLPARRSRKILSTRIRKLPKNILNPEKGESLPDVSLRRTNSGLHTITLVGPVLALMQPVELPQLMHISLIDSKTRPRRSIQAVNKLGQSWQKVSSPRAFLRRFLLNIASIRLVFDTSFVTWSKDFNSKLTMTPRLVVCWTYVNVISSDGLFGCLQYNKWWHRSMA